MKGRWDPCSEPRRWDLESTLFFFLFFFTRIVCWLVGVAVVVSWVSDVALDR